MSQSACHNRKNSPGKGAVHRNYKESLYRSGRLADAAQEIAPLVRPVSGIRFPAVPRITVRIRGAGVAVFARTRTIRTF